MADVMFGENCTFGTVNVEYAAVTPLMIVPCAQSATMDMIPRRKAG